MECTRNRRRNLGKETNRSKHAFSTVESTVCLSNNIPGFSLLHSDARAPNRNREKNQSCNFEQFNELGDFILMSMNLPIINNIIDLLKNLMSMFHTERIQLANLNWFQ